MKSFDKELPPQHFFKEWQEAHATPKVFRNLVADWPIVAAGAAGFSSVKAHLLNAADKAASTKIFVAPKSYKGRYGYGTNLREFNFETHVKTIPQTLNIIAQSLEDEIDFNVYAGSMPTSKIFPSISEQNILPFVLPEVEPSLWVGTTSRIATHFDSSQNIACVVAGTRRFTLFPPSQTENMYLGPLDYTPAGQCISLVDPNAADLKRFPKFEEALKHKILIELEPGDAIFIPAMWWHSVECTDPFGVLMNFWWNSSQKAAIEPANALLATFLAVNHLPKTERAAWLNMFNYFAFETCESKAGHISEQERGLLGPSIREKR